MSQLPADPSPETSRASECGLGWQMAGILAGAILLGLTYNQISPLGVRAPRAVELAGGRPAAAGAAAKPATARPGYVNETLAMSLEEIIPTPLVAMVAPPAEAGIPALTWIQVKPLLAASKIVLVDARPQSAYDFDHIPGAVSLPGTSLPADIQAFAARYSKSTAFVIYCSSDMCGVSRQLAGTLVKTAGLTNVSCMPGGYTEYLVAERSGRT